MVAVAVTERLFALLIYPNLRVRTHVVPCVVVGPSLDSSIDSTFGPIRIATLIEVRMLYIVVLGSTLRVTTN